MENSKSGIQLGSLWMVVSAIGFAAMGYFVKILSQDFNFSELLFWRMFITVLALIIPALIYKRDIHTQHFKAHLVLGIIGTIALFLSFYLLTHLPLGTATTLAFTSAIWTIVFSIIFFKQPYNIGVIICALLGFIGVILLVNPSFIGGKEQETLIGVLSGAVAAMAYIQTKELSILKEPEWRIVFYFSLFALLISGVWTCFTGFHVISLNNGLLIIGMGIGALVGRLCLTLAYSKGNMFTSSVLSYLTIVFSSLVGFFILGDIVTRKEIFGILLIVFSGILSSLLDNPQAISELTHYFKKNQK